MQQHTFTINIDGKDYTVVPKIWHGRSVFQVIIDNQPVLFISDDAGNLRGSPVMVGKEELFSKISVAIEQKFM